MISKIIDKGFGPESPYILNGTYMNPPGVDDFTITLLPFFKHTKVLLEAISTDIVMKELYEVLKKMKKYSYGESSDIKFGTMK